MIRIRQIKIEVSDKSDSLLKDEIERILKEKVIDYKINKKSIDARKEKVYFIYEVDVNVLNEERILKRKNINILKTPKENYEYTVTGTKKLDNNIVIVGMGPAGLFSGYMMLKYGYKVTMIERGSKIEDRVQEVEDFFKTNNLNTESNVQFGEGGAGTFSDGKLNTLVKDKKFLMKKVFEIFVENGANEEILYENKPHIGTDQLRNVIINMRNNMIKMGADIRFNTKLTDLIIKNNRIDEIEVNNNERIKTDVLVLAIGHSARDTYELLKSKKVFMESKPFAIGIRISHKQDFINKSQYKEYSKFLKSASYKLTYTAKDNRSVYSFCMCPGGYVVNSSSEKESLCINGMSNYKRDTENANSALVVSINDFNDPFEAINFQRELEKKSYLLGNKKIPIQLLSDFYDNKKSDSFRTIKPVYKGDYEFSNINDILPKYVCDDLKEAINYFDTKIIGYKNPNALISCVESRTSSPVRITRDDNYMCNIKGIFPVGEGAGYSGGITTSAMDGIRVFEKIGKIYRQ